MGWVQLFEAVRRMFRTLESLETRSPKAAPLVPQCGAAAATLTFGLNRLVLSCCCSCGCSFSSTCLGGHPSSGLPGTTYSGGDGGMSGFRPGGAAVSFQSGNNNRGSKVTTRQLTCTARVWHQNEGKSDQLRAPVGEVKHRLDRQMLQLYWIFTLRTRIRHGR